MYRWVWIMLLCVAGMLLLSACFFGGTVMSAQYDHAQDYQTGAFSYEAAKVRQVNVNWYSGSVSLKVTEREKPEVRESGTDLPAEKALHWRLDGEVLYVEFCASGYVGRFSGADKKLTVEVPKGILLNVTTTSAGIAADIGEQAEVTLHSTSGTIEVTDGTGGRETDPGHDLPAAFRRKKWKRRCWRRRPPPAPSGWKARRLRSRQAWKAPAAAFARSG